MPELIPVFKTHGSLGKSILTAEDERDKKGIVLSAVKENSPVSIFTLAQQYNLDKLVVCDDSFLNFPTLYKTSNKRKIQLVFGVNLTICNNVTEKNDDGLLSNCKVSVYMKNSKAYQDLLKLHNAINAEKENFYYTPRGDWKILQKYWTNNLKLVIGPYNSFLERNLLDNGNCVPEFGKIKPLFMFSKMELPFDEILINKIQEFSKSNNFECMECHPIYYYKNSHFKFYQNLRCISNRAKFNAPDIDYLCSDRFSFESYLNKKKMYDWK